MNSKNALKIAVCILLALFSSCGKKEEKQIIILETTDLHGVVMPYDYIEKKPLDASLAHSAGYIRSLRSSSENLFLLDNGDNLQGQPAVYYYNYIDTLSPHILSQAMNWLDYDAASVGNHDIEAGHDVYDRLVLENDFPLLAANAVDKKSGDPYFTPFVIIEKEGVRIAVLGLITPAVPTWLPEVLYSGIEFRDMVETAKLWMPEIIRQKPDVIVGLFHSGWDREGAKPGTGSPMNENGTADVAYNVPGFDIIFCGHDHREANEKFANINGDSVLILNAGSRSETIARADVKFSVNRITGRMRKKMTGSLIKVKDYNPDNDFIEAFRSQDEVVKKYVNKVIGNSRASISTRDAYFGSSAFVDMIHSIQIDITGADISFAAPLSFDVSIPKGEITVGDMFKLYRFENMLYTMELKGEEIEKYLEFSYSGWLNVMKSPGDYLLKYRLDKDGKPVLTNNQLWLRNQPYNFDSAAGLEYIVDASKPDGQKVEILGFTDGRKFQRDVTYRVAVNSYRGNGGGGHFAEGAGIKNDDLMTRVVASTERDLRYYIMKYIEEKKNINPQQLNNWKIIPEQWVKSAAARERELLFGTRN